MSQVLVTTRDYIPSQVNATVNTTAAAPTVGVLNQYDCTSGALAPALPLASTVPNGKVIGFKKTDASVNALTATCSGSDKIDSASGSTSLPIRTQNQIAWLTSDGVQYWTRSNGALSLPALDARFTSSATLPAALTRTNTCVDPDCLTSAGTIWTCTQANSALASATHTYANGSTRTGGKITFSAQVTISNSILHRVGRTTAVDVGVTAGALTEFSLRMTASVPGTYQLGIAFYDASNAFLSTLYGKWTSILANAETANTVGLVVTVPANATHCVFQLNTPKNTVIPSGATFFATAATSAVVPTGTTFPYPGFSGADTGAAWSGTAGASTSTLTLTPAPDLSGGPTSALGSPVVSAATQGGNTGAAAWGLKTLFSPPVEVFNELNTVGWPAGTLFADATYIGEVYDTIASGAWIVHFRRRGLGAAAAEAPVVVADFTGSGLNSDCNSAGVAPNGDYVALMRRGSNTGGLPATLTGSYLHRSTDKGATWDAGTAMTDQTSTAFGNTVTSISGQFTTQAGSTLFTYKGNTGALSFGIGRNTTRDLTGNWTLTPITGTLDGSNGGLEGTFAQFNDGTIICMIRNPAGGSQSSTAALIYSSDDGVTWSSIVTTDAIMPSSPCALLHHTYTDTVEVLAGDRQNLVITQYVATKAQAIAGTFGAPTTVLKAQTTILNAYVFAYPAAVALKDGRVLLRYMDLGTATAQSIWEAWGVRPVSPAIVPDTTDIPKLAGAIASPGSGTTSPAWDHVHPRFDWSPVDHGLLGWNFDVEVAGNTQIPTAGTLFAARIHVPVAQTISKLGIYIVTGGSVLTANECFMGLYTVAASPVLLSQSGDCSGTTYTVSTIATTATVTGTGFTAGMVGMQYTIAGVTGTFTVQAVGSSTSLTMTTVIPTTVTSATMTPAVSWLSSGLKLAPLQAAQAVAAGDYLIQFYWGAGTTGPTLSRGAGQNVINANLSAANSRHATSSTGLTTTLPNPSAVLAANSSGFWVCWT